MVADEAGLQLGSQLETAGTGAIATKQASTAEKGEPSLIL